MMNIRCPKCGTYTLTNTPHQPQGMEYTTLICSSCESSVIVLPKDESRIEELENEIDELESKIDELESENIRLRMTISNPVASQNSIPNQEPNPELDFDLNRCR